jgi:small GTP-binding protein
MQSQTLSLESTADVWCIALSNDGRRLIFGDIDKSLRIWDVKSKKLISVLKGRIGSPWNVAMNGNGKRAISGSDSGIVRVWDVRNSDCLATFKLGGRDAYAVALSNDGNLAAAGGADKEVRVWDVQRKTCIAHFKAHTSEINCVAFSADNTRLISAAGDPALRLWDLKRQECIQVLEGHTDQVYSAAFSPDGSLVVSGSDDKTLRLWDTNSSRCLGIFEGHTNDIWALAWSRDNRFILSGSDDGTVRVWDLDTNDSVTQFETKSGGVWSVAWRNNDKTIVAATSTGHLWTWDFQSTRPSTHRRKRGAPCVSGKVLLVGPTGVGKSALVHRLVHKSFLPTTSTDGAWVSQFKLKASSSKSDQDREIWLWDFAGQSDYRLINQLFMNETSLGLLVFNPQSDTLFDDISQWNRDLQQLSTKRAKKILVASKLDRGGLMVSRRSFDNFRKSRGFADYIETSAQKGTGCVHLEEAIVNNIDWKTIPPVASTEKFGLLKEEIIKLRDNQNSVVLTIGALQQCLRRRLPATSFTEADLQTVIEHLQRPGILWKLDFGEYVLLQPEYIASYAGALIRKLRSDPKEMGTIQERVFLAGDLEYQNTARLSQDDEPVLLRAMLQTLISKRLCFRQSTRRGTMLVFPSYFRRDRPVRRHSPKPFVTYSVSGPIDGVYLTLVVSLHYMPLFRTTEFWKDAVDFRTANDKLIGLTLTKESDGKGRVDIFFEGDIRQDIKAIVLLYVDKHLRSKSSALTRLRHYVCPNCQTAFPDSTLALTLLEEGRKSAACVLCERRIPLYDAIERKFASEAIKKRVQVLADRVSQIIDNESKEQILEGYAFVIAGEAGQIYRPTSRFDYGIDGEIEFRDRNGMPSAQKVWLQLKAGDSHLITRKRDGAEIFIIESWHVEYWSKHNDPVMLVIQTSDGQIRWMDIRSCLSKQPRNIKQIVFTGTPFTAESITKLRDEILSRREGEVVFSEDS